MLREERQEPRVGDLLGRSRELAAEDPAQHEARQERRRAKRINERGDGAQRECALGIRLRERVRLGRGAYEGAQCRFAFHAYILVRNRRLTGALWTWQVSLRHRLGSWIQKVAAVRTGLRNTCERGIGPSGAGQDHRQAGREPREERHRQRADEHGPPDREFQKGCLGPHERQPGAHQNGQRQRARRRLGQLRQQARIKLGVHALRSFARAIFHASSSSSFRSSTSASTMPTRSCSSDPPQKRSMMEWTARAATLVRGTRAR